MKNVKLTKGKSPALPWEVYVSRSATTNGKRIRKRFETRAEAQHWADKYEALVLEKERSPLDPEIYRVVALFADKLTAAQMMVGLTEAAERFGLANCTLEDLGKEFMTHQKMLLERGSVGALHVKDTKSRTKKLVAELGDIPIQSIGTDMLDAYVNKRLADRNKGDKKTSPRTVKNEVTTLSALFNFAIKRAIHQLP